MQYTKYEIQMVKSEVKETKVKYYAYDSDSVYRFLLDFCEMDKMTKEHLIELALSAKGEIIGYHIVAVGDLTGAIVHPREVFQFAIIANAASIIVAHNHPSGDPSPSINDIAITKRLKEAGKLIGIKLLDHLVIGEHGYETISV